jgi:predicted nucleotidyltransferase
MFGYAEEMRKPKVKVEPFTIDDAKKIAKRFVGVGGIYQVDVFGSIARTKAGQDIDLIFVVQDERVFNRFVDLVTRFKLNDPHYQLTIKQHRTAAFQQIWGYSNPSWRKCLTHRTEDLLEFVDIIVLPWSWQLRIDELESKMNNDSPRFLENIRPDVVILATEP